MTTQSIETKAWTKTVLFLLLALLFGVFLLLNMSALVEPRVHLVFFKYERPALLMVLLFTATVGFVAGLSIRAVVATLREIRAARSRSDVATVKRELADLKSAANASIK